jgi:uncharacterized protein YaaN involved in tellurite resistance
MTKKQFIKKYQKIHNDIDSLERQIEEYISNKEEIVKDYSLLESLKEKVTKQIDLLNKTRKHEAKVFGY